MQLTLLCGVVCLLLLVIPVDLNGISCVARDAVVDSRTHFTCVFDRDINETKTGFLIWKYPISSPQPNNSHREHVLSCNWKDSTPECILESEKGYSFDYRISNTVSVDIASANKPHEGTYLCQLVLNEGSVSNCSIRVTTTSTTAIAEDETASLKTAIIEHIIAISILAVAATLLLTSNIVTCCWARRKLQTKRRNQNYVYETEEVQEHTKKGYLCWARGTKPKKQKPALEVEEEELVLPERLTVKYPPNSVHKSTQHFVDVLDKNLQIGDPGPLLQTADVETQLGRKDDFPIWNTIPDTGSGVKIGSSERYNNPTITHLGKPAVIPLPLVPTADDLEKTFAKVIDANNQVRQTTRAERSISC